MSVKFLTYLVYGVMLNKHSLTDEMIEKYTPDTRKKSHGFNEPVLITDPMSGSYKVFGYIYKQTDLMESFNEVTSMPEMSGAEAAMMADTLKDTFGLPETPELEWLIVPHYY